MTATCKCDGMVIGDLFVAPFLSTRDSMSLVAILLALSFSEFTARKCCRASGLVGAFQKTEPMRRRRERRRRRGRVRGEGFQKDFDLTQSQHLRSTWRYCQRFPWQKLGWRHWALKSPPVRWLWVGCPYLQVFGDLFGFLLAIRLQNFLDRELSSLRRCLCAAFYLCWHLGSWAVVRLVWGSTNQLAHVRWLLMPLVFSGSFWSTQGVWSSSASLLSDWSNILNGAQVPEN